jgi:hypothetical protein
MSPTAAVKKLLKMGKITLPGSSAEASHIRRVVQKYKEVYGGGR